MFLFGFWFGLGWVWFDCDLGLVLGLVWFCSIVFGLFWWFVWFLGLGLVWGFGFDLWFGLTWVGFRFGLVRLVLIWFGSGWFWVWFSLIWDWFGLV